MTTIPDAAIEAAAEAHYEAQFGQAWAYVLDAARETYRLRVCAAIEAAMPAIREAIAQEIEAAQPAPPPAVGPWMIGVPYAARIVRGGIP